MKSDLNVVVMPEPGNCGEDLNWIEWMVIGHPDPASMKKPILDAHVKTFTISMKDRRYKRKYVCSIESCKNILWARGWCNSHYQLWRRWGDPNKRIGLQTKCSVEDCDTASRVKGLCDKHYRQITWATDPEKREARKARNKRYRDQNPDKVKSWYQNNLATHLASNRNRLAKFNNTPGIYDSNKVYQRMLYFGFKCWMCDGPFEHVDHVKPLSKGGSNWPSNLRPACKACNLKKATKWPIQTSPKIVKSKQILE